MTHAEIIAHHDQVISKKENQTEKDIEIIDEFLDQKTTEYRAIGKLIDRIKTQLNCSTEDAADTAALMLTNSEMKIEDFVAEIDKITDEYIYNNRCIIGLIG